MPLLSYFEVSTVNLFNGHVATYIKGHLFTLNTRTFIIRTNALQSTLLTPELLECQSVVDLSFQHEHYRPD